MRIESMIVAVVVSLLGGVPAATAQSDAPAALSPAEIAANCAPPPAPTNAAHALRVVGAQDTTPRSIFDNRDLIVVNGGTAAGVQLGSTFFVRHTTSFGTAYIGDVNPPTTVTDGWVRVVAVNDQTAIVRAEHVCSAIFAGDYLEPYAAPQLADVTDRPIDPDFEHMGRVLSSAEGRRIAAPGEFAILDRGSEQGLQPGSRVAFYRDLTAGGMYLVSPPGTPLTAIGEAVVVSTTGNRALVRVVRARDAVEAGDYAAPGK